MMYKTIGLTGLAALLVLLGACSDSETTTNDGAGGSGAGMTTANGGSAPTGSGGGGSGPTNCSPISGCEAPEPSHLGDMAAIDGITVSYIDQDGAAAVGVQTTVCGTNICSQPADSGSDGTVMVDSSEITNFENPRFNAGHNGLEYAKFSGQIPVTSGSHDFGTVRVIRMPAFTDGVAIAAGETASQGGVSITLDAAAEFQHSCVDYPEPSQRVFRGAVVDITGWSAAESPQIDQTLGIESIVVAMPLGTHICPGVEMSFDNVMGYAANSEVDIYENGAKTFKHYAPYGQWEKVSEGVVSADGTTIVTKAGMGIQSLGTFGIAPK